MRLAVALILLLPVAALAQTAPAPTKPAPVTTAKPAATAPTKPAAAHPAATKPAGTLPHPAAKSAPVVKKPPPARKPAAAPAPVVPAAPPPAADTAPAEPTKGSVSGLPLPRFAALRSEEVNFRSGPGTRYPIEWVYKRRDLPVEIEREFDAWRLVRDPDGNKGWVHKATLAGRRSAVVVGARRALRTAASDTAGPVAELQPGVIVRLRTCDAGSDWCQAQIGDYRGYIRRNELWGLLPNEVVQP